MLLPVRLAFAVALLLVTVRSLVAREYIRPSSESGALSGAWCSSVSVSTKVETVSGLAGRNELEGNFQALGH